MRDAGTPTQSTRESYLDGLRGIAALIVVVFHFMSAYLPSWIPDQTPRPFWLSDTPFAISYNGTFWVVVFFVLSGFVVANSAAKKRDPIALNLALRYIRLALPATVSVVFAWALLTLMPNEATHLNALIPHQWLRSTYQGDIPSFLSALAHGFWGIFATGTSHFNNVLWTMQIELVGSFFIYIFYGLTQVGRRSAFLVAIGFAILLLRQPLDYEGFVFGALMREAWAQNRLPTIFPVPVFLLGAILGSPSTGFYDRTGLPHIPHTLTLGAKDGLFYPIAAAMIVYGCIASPSLQAIFSMKVPRFLGRISFSLYLFHVPLLYTIFAIAYATLYPISRLRLVGLSTLFIPTSIALAYLFTAVVDEPVLRLNKLLRDKWHALERNSGTKRAQGDRVCDFS